MSDVDGRARILLVNMYQHDDTGDAARQLCIVESLLSRMPDAKLTAVVPDRATQVSVQGTSQGRVRVIREALPSASLPICFNPLRIPALIRAYLTADVVISTGGHFGQVSSLFPLLLGIMLGKRIAICSASTGLPFRKRWHAFLAKQILERSTLILLREEISRRHLEILRLTKPQIHLTADPAFLLRSPDKLRIDEILLEEGVGDAKPLIGINVSRPPNSNRDTYKQYIGAMTKLTTYLTEELGAMVVLVPFCLVRGHDDRLESARVKRLIGDTQRIKAVTRELSPAELQGILGRMELFVGTRAHANIFALSMGVPTLALSYHHKMDGIMEDLGMSEWVCGCAAADASELIAKVKSLWTLKEHIRAQLRERVSLMAEKAALNAKLIEALLVTAG